MKTRFAFTNKVAEKADNSNVFTAIFMAVIDFTVVAHADKIKTGAKRYMTVMHPMRDVPFICQSVHKVQLRISIARFSTKPKTDA